MLSIDPINPKCTATEIANRYFALLNGESKPFYVPTSATNSIKSIEITSDTNVAMLLNTSGSSGAPKIVALSKEQLLTSARLSNERLQVKTGDTWSLQLPLTHIAGFNVLTRSYLAGSNLIYDTNKPADYTSIVPTQLHNAIYGDREKDKQLLKHLLSAKKVLVGGASLEGNLLRNAGDLGINIVTSYGMTEMCGGCVYDGVALPGTNVKLINENRNIIELSGPTMALGYFDIESKNIQAFQNDLGENVFRTNDLGQVVDGKLQVIGRADDIIISGGINISLSQLESFLINHFPDLHFCAVGVFDQRWGQKLCLAVAPAYKSDAAPNNFDIDNSNFENAEMIARIEAEFGAHYVPKEMIFINHIPMLALGKVDRKTIIKLFK